MPDVTPIERLRSGTAPRSLRMALAEGMIPLDGADLIESLHILAIDPDQDIQEALRDNIPTLPRPMILQVSRDLNTPQDLLNVLAQVYLTDDEILTGVILNKNVSDETLVRIAESAPPSILVLLSDNKQRMLSYPGLLEILIQNQQLPKATMYSLLEFKEKWLAQAIGKSTGSGPEESDKKAADPAEIPVQKTTAQAASADGLKETDLAIPDQSRAKAESEAAEPVKTAASTTPGVPHPEKDQPIPDKTMKQPETVKLKKPLPKKKTEEGKSIKLDDGWDLEELEEMPEADDEYGFEDADMDFQETLETTGAEQEKVMDGWDDLDFSDEDAEDDSLEDGDRETQFEDEKIEDTRMRLLRLGAAEKLILAKMGTKQERAVLVRDSNKKVAVAVVQSPKMSEFEIKLIASNRSVCEEVLGEIYNHREYGQDPGIQRELVLNPKTPFLVANRLLNKLSDFDLKEVSRSKEVPNALVQSAKRILDMREARRNRRKQG